MLVAAGSSPVLATVFNYNSGDVLICFRQSGGGTYDLVVDAGPVSAFTNLAIGSKIVVNPTYYTGTQLGKLGTNNISWTAFAYFDSNVPAGLTNAIFMSDPWPDSTTQPDPWARASATAQSLTIGHLKAIGLAATNYVNTTNISSSTASFVPESVATPPYESYLSALGANLDFHGTFQGVPEQNTGANFTTGGTPVRADFYELMPYSGFPAPNGVYWGYFELSTNGVMTYTAGPAPTVLVEPTIVSITRIGTTSTISFTTGSSGTYTLYGTNNLAAPMANWPAINSTPGNGSQQSLQDVTTGGSKFYRVGAQ